MKPNGRRSACAQIGFTLVEIMVGLAIGMLATVVIIQVISVFEAQRRSTAGSADAQTNGGIALYNIGRELQMAGYPLIPVTNSPLECTTLTIDGVADASAPNRLTPVAVVEGVAAAGVSASDTITIRYGNSNMGGVPALITAPGVPNPSDETVSNNFGCQVGDPCWESVALRGLGLVAAARGDVDRALELLVDAPKLSRRLPDTYLWIEAYALDALCAVAVDSRAEAAPRWIDELEAIAARRGIRELLLRATVYRARLGEPGALAAARSLAAQIENPALAGLFPGGELSAVAV